MAEEKTETADKVNRKATRTGVVVSNKMQKTVVVAVERRVLHPAYQKYVKHTNRFMAHDETNDCGVGDKVVIEESRPLSKRKRWNVKEVIGRAS
ncbi:MAG: 30S ribosomal protein S17 [Acidobacteriota bacterium]